MFYDNDDPNIISVEKQFDNFIKKENYKNLSIHKDASGRNNGGYTFIIEINNNVSVDELRRKLYDSIKLNNYSCYVSAHKQFMQLEYKRNEHPLDDTTIILGSDCINED